ncbi:MAG: DUF1682 domain-containing protein [Bacteroidetes bacterium]|nr:DUF1682 domain-containing protein [Bacteroidota bacterium]
MKKQMNWIPFLFLMAFGFSPVLLTAQADGEGPRKGVRAEKHMAKLTEELDLSPEQVAAIEKMEAGFEEEEQAVKEQMDKARAELRALHNAKKTEMEKILTEAQKAKLEEMKKERHERFKKHHGRKGHHPHKKPYQQEDRG